ncbi:hypothetical protein A1S_3798 [Acinetobacter baumannii ATCC 17978]|nr:hypothetical protein A1S_3798 [Acinetobacter baumannii ATCC 17978]
MPKISTTGKALAKSLLLAQGVLDQAKKYSTLPFTQTHIIRPRIDEKYYSWTHYGIFFPIFTRAASLLKYYDFNRYTRCTCF